MSTESQPASLLVKSGLRAETELTPRALILGAVLTVVFTAANVYFGLKAGLTFSTSIPAVVISPSRPVIERRCRLQIGQPANRRNCR